ncbi:hypothetical protein [Phocaeicola salanitronis]|uniref:hypothetical protein n=1 Tax=Phocaeicola salanitronis TaxID=376805 RepID=UPI0023F8ED59|nr:hypothetical protein [Phocaeicola salanitronis]
MFSFCQIDCRGVSHTPESVHVNKWVYPGVCDTPLHGLASHGGFVIRRNQTLRICNPQHPR